VKGYLRQPRAVAQIDKYKAAVVAPAVHPSEERHLPAHMAFAQIAAVAGSFEINKRFCHDLSPVVSNA
jgi:hypothetical protein